MPDSVSSPPVLQYTNFAFAHKGLNLEGIYFTLSLGTLEPVMRVRLADMDGVVRLRDVPRALDIDPDSGDAHLLQIVERSLRYVRQIRPGDKIPNEILDGTASWTVDERHRERMAINLAELLLKAVGTGAKPAVVGSGDAAMDRVREVAEAICARIGLPTERRSEVVERIELLINELSFVEALRDHFRPLADIPRHLRDIARRNMADTEFCNQINTTQRLLKEQHPRLKSHWEEAFASVKDPIAALTSIDSTVKNIRQRRDSLHFETMRWGDIPAAWNAVDPGSDEAADNSVRLYRFMLQNFMTIRSWAGNI